MGNTKQKKRDKRRKKQKVRQKKENQRLQGFLKNYKKTKDNLDREEDLESLLVESESIEKFVELLSPSVGCLFDSLAMEGDQFVADFCKNSFASRGLNPLVHGGDPDACVVAREDSVFVLDEGLKEFDLRDRELVLVSENCARLGPFEDLGEAIKYWSNLWNEVSPGSSKDASMMNIDSGSFSKGYFS